VSKRSSQKKFSSWGFGLDFYQNRTGYWQVADSSCFGHLIASMDTSDDMGIDVSEGPGDAPATCCLMLMSHIDMDAKTTEPTVPATEDSNIVSDAGSLVRVKSWQ